MKRNVVVINILTTLIGMLLLNNVCARGGGHCGEESRDLKPYDALMWRMANPNECGKGFFIYQGDVKRIYQSLKPEEQNSQLVTMLIKKHIGELVEHLANEKKTGFTYATNFESYCDSLLFYEEKGFKIPIGKRTRHLLLQERYLERLEDALKELRTTVIRPETHIFRDLNGQSRAESLAIEINWLATEKLDMTLKEIGISKEELEKYLFFSKTLDRK